MQQLRAIWQHPFWRRVATLLSGSVIAQGLGLALLPVLGNLYPETDFGLQGIFIAIIHTLVIATNGGYEQAIMLPKADRDARALLQLSLGINAAFCALSAFLMFLLSPWLWDILKAPELAGYWGWLILSLWLEGNIAPLRIMLNRQQSYRMLSISRVVQAVVSGSLMVGLGWKNPQALDLIMGWTAGQAAGWLCILTAYWQKRNPDAVSWGNIRRLAHEYRDFPTHAVGAGWLNSFSRQLPFFLLNGFFGLQATGYFFMAHRALMLPLSLVSRSVGEVFYKQATEAQAAGELKRLSHQMARQLSLLALPILIGVMLLGPWAAEWVLGEEWREAGVFARWLMPWLYLMFITSPLTYILDIQRRLDFQLKYNVALFAVRLGALLFGGYLLTATPTLMLYAGVGAIMVGFHLGYLLKIAGDPIPDRS